MYGKLRKSTWACSPGAVSNASSLRAVYAAAATGHTAPPSSSCPGTPGPGPPGPAPGNSSTPLPSAGRYARRRGPAAAPAAAAAWAAWPQGTSGTSGPCCGTRPAPGQFPGSNGPPLSSRRSLSPLPPSAMCLTHLRRVPADDATITGWVSSFLLLSPICKLLPTMKSPAGRNSPGHRAPPLNSASSGNPSAHLPAWTPTITSGFTAATWTGPSGRWNGTAQSARPGAKPTTPCRRAPVLERRPGAAMRRRGLLPTHARGDGRPGNALRSQGCVHRAAGQTGTVHPAYRPFIPGMKQYRPTA